MVKAAVTISTALAAISVGPGGFGYDPVDRALTVETMRPATMNRIAYISPNGELFTSSPDGADAVQLTGLIEVEQHQGGLLGQSSVQGLLFAWPTWSPDSAKLAASRVLLKDGTTEMSVQVVELRTRTFTTVYRNQVPSLVTDRAPHYIYWAPDSKTLSFLAAGTGSVNLYLWDSVSGSDPVAIESDSPLYYQWAVDSGSMILHAGAEVKVRMFHPAGMEERISVDARGFRVPAFSPDGSQVAYVGDTSRGGALFIAPTDNLGSSQQIMEVAAFSAFLWSPDGSMLAVADQSTTGTPLFERLVLVPVTGGKQQELVAERIMAFFWAPTGERIAWAAVDSQQGQVEWVVAPILGGEKQRLFRFRPSTEMLTLLSFFDQYAYSNTLWSPDGTALVVAGIGEESSNHRNGSGPSGSRIYVLDAVDGGKPQPIAAGSVACWSWS